MDNLTILLGAFDRFDPWWLTDLLVLLGVSIQMVHALPDSTGRDYPWLVARDAAAPMSRRSRKLWLKVEEYLLASGWLLIFMGTGGNLAHRMYPEDDQVAIIVAPMLFALLSGLFYGILRLVSVPRAGRP